MSSTPVPVRTVDFGPFRDGSSKQSVADAFLESFKTIGFVYLINHGLEQQKIDRMFELAFFALPHETKMMAPHPSSGTHHRGYSSPGREKNIQSIGNSDSIASSHLPLDAKESFEVGREDDELMPNIWLPQGILPDFRQRCLQFFWDCFEIEKDILRALALGFNLSEDYFLKTHTKPDNQLRLLHYPSIPAEKLLSEEVSRINAHPDFGSITLLMQDDIGGLEARDPISGDFTAVPPIPGAILVNAGDFMMRWSNDIIKSTVHRVRAPPTFRGNIVPERYSIPYFCSSDFDTVVDFIPNTWSENNPKKYKPTSAKEYMFQKLAASY